MTQKICLISTWRR